MPGGLDSLLGDIQLGVHPRSVPNAGLGKLGMAPDELDVSEGHDATIDVGAVAKGKAFRSDRQRSPSNGSEEVCIILIGPESL